MSAAVFLLNMSLEEGNSAPSTHLMSGILETVSGYVDKLYVVTRPYEGEDCETFARIKESCNVSHKMIDVPTVGRGNIAKRFLNDRQYFLKASIIMGRLDDVSSVFIQSCVNPFAAVRLTRKALPNARITYNVQDIYSEAAVCRGLVSRNSPLFKLFSWMESKAYDQADCVITIAQGMAKSIELAGCDESKLAVIHNWTYSDSPIEIPLSDNQFLKDNGLDDGKYKVVYAGNIGALQDVDSLVDAATILRDNESIEFVIVGDGVRAEAIRSTVARRKLDNVRLFDRQPSNVVEQVYSLADLNVITLMPGMTRAALPSKTAICLACGKPILLSADIDSEYSERMLSTGNCVVCRPKDPQGLADSILKAQAMKREFDPAGSRRLFEECFNGDNNKLQYRDCILGGN